LVVPFQAHLNVPSPDLSWSQVLFYCGTAFKLGQLFQEITQQRDSRHYSSEDDFISGFLALNRMFVPTTTYILS